ncbi:HTH domain-containing protein [Rhizobium leguminosarum bv. viciae]|uniref:AAA family ATPase n=1 Tax=Rhizobium leguminosarum TaxID=384 RepID=UPI00103E8231|nr:AAA family ATPase [Rhizobium leguminosarum]TCB30469.1 HTH domain-containing protein [Rhizobium leguminosarum bv. viciae]
MTDEEFRPVYLNDLSDVGSGEQPRRLGNGDGSNRNFGPKPDAAPLGNGKSRRRRERPYQGLITTQQFLGRMLPPDYLVDGLLLRGSTYTLTGPTGHGKTLVALLMAIRISRGEWFCGRKCRKGPVTFFAAENPDNVRIQFFSLCAEMGIEPETVDIRWHDGLFNLDTAIAAVRADLAACPELGFCIFDSLQAFFQSDDDNANMAMLDLALDFRDLTAGHPNRPASVIIAHPSKNASKANLLPRGGSAITNELDGNLTCWADNGIVELHNHGKFRGVPFDPIKLELAVVRPEGLLDARGDQMGCTIIRPLPEGRESEILRQEGNREIAILEAIERSPGITQTALASLLNVGRTTIQRDLDALTRKKWIRDYSGRKKILAEGERALELARK